MRKNHKSKVASAEKARLALTLGGLVKIRHSGGRVGRIVEFRGPLGPGGVQIYRVRIGGDPKPDFIELREDQLEPVPADS